MNEDQPTLIHLPWLHGDWNLIASFCRGPIVPWFWIRPWLKRHCTKLREYKIIARADHNVLGTAPDLAAATVLRWMSEAKAAG